MKAILLGALALVSISIDAMQQNDQKQEDDGAPAAERPASALLDALALAVIVSPEPPSRYQWRRSESPLSEGAQRKQRLAKFRSSGSLVGPDGSPVFLEEGSPALALAGKLRILSDDQIEAAAHKGQLRSRSNDALPDSHKLDASARSASAELAIPKSNG